MKKILFTFCLLAFMQTSWAQTKEETENWFKEKVEKQNKMGGVDVTTYRSNYIDREFFKNIKIEFVDGTINFSYEEYGVHTGREDDLSSSYRLENIVIFAIDSVFEQPGRFAKGGNSRNVIYLKLNKWLAEEYDIKEITIYKSDNHRFIGRWALFKLPLYSDLEENFLERFKKAIEHYKKFYPKPIKKDTF